MKTRRPTAPSDAMRNVLSVLSHLGWGLGRLPAPDILDTGGDASLKGTEWLALPLPDAATLLCVVPPSDLPDLRRSFERYEDLAPLHGRILHALDRSGIGGGYVLMAGGDSAHLVDRAAQDVLVATSSREEAGDRLYPLLDFQALSRGALSSFPRKPLRRRARELAEWTHLWSARIGSGLDLASTAMQGFFEWLHLARLADIRGVGPASGSFADMTGAVAGGTVRRFVEERFRALHGTWNLLQGESNARSIPGILKSIDDRVLTECMASYALLSLSKFAAEVFAEAFADEELQHLSWRTSVTADARGAADADESGDSLLNSVVSFDLEREGCSQLLRCFDALADAVRQSALDRDSARERGERPGLQLDLLAESPGELGPHESARHVMRRMLPVRAGSPRHAALARMILLARACEWHAARGARELPFARANVFVESETTLPVCGEN